MIRPHRGPARSSSRANVPLLLLSLLALTLGGARAAQAQTATERTLIGRVTSGGRPILGALVRLVQGSTVRETRTTEDGQYRLYGLSTGSWIFSVQAVGYRRAAGRFEYTGPGATRDFVLDPLPTPLDTVLVTARLSGIRVIVGDGRTLRPLDSAHVHVMGSKIEAVTTDSTGRFELERPSGRDLTLMVQRPGYARRIVQAKVPDEGMADIRVLLDSAESTLTADAAWQDAVVRLRLAGMRAIQIGREEIAATGAPTLLDAVRVSPSYIKQVLGLFPGGCLFVDGMPRPGLRLEHIASETVDFIEIYPGGSEQSKTLERRWPFGADCAAADLVSDSQKRLGNRTEYIVVWTRPQARTP